MTYDKDLFRPLVVWAVITFQVTGFGKRAIATYFAIRVGYEWDLGVENIGYDFLEDFFEDGKMVLGHVIRPFPFSQQDFGVKMAEGYDTSSVLDWALLFVME